MSLPQRLREALAKANSADLLTGDIAGRRGSATPAAVLIAITERKDPGVILTVRKQDLRTHAGQIAFPGGRVDDGEDAIAAALREAHEELELEPRDAQVIGHLQDYRTITGYIVTPVVAVVPPDLPLRPHDREVADWFEAPLSFLIDPARQEQQSVLFEGEERTYYQINWEGRQIWGATAAMLVNLSRGLHRT